MNTLIRIGVLRFSGKNKKVLNRGAYFLHKRVNKIHPFAVALFQEKPVEFKLPKLHQSVFEDAMDEIELLGFTFCGVFTLVDTDVSKYVTAKQFSQYFGRLVGRYFMLLYYLKPVFAVKGQLMFCGNFIDKNGDWTDSVHFPVRAEKHWLTGMGFYHIKGKVVGEFCVQH